MTEATHPPRSKQNTLPYLVSNIDQIFQTRSHHFPIRKVSSPFFFEISALAFYSQRLSKNP
ncbi:hypothetical protein M422DRAFT_36107 [Sphaerobolus stellatus SS14]|uniref:Uncharacterized protein n=1 Tax=Sphaerobolus stellatus (strain SS14) TaxID=990650 RepID=A0A0C9TP94_SPHS4|nr:hypothetical protein M422DRAFT_37070 [Sphaerobolus stellatus SS14]KIJ31858.1 hypothetical protein M422DRAFT_36107 [Sphaerobolus stellatus SS14]